LGTGMLNPSVDGEMTDQHTKGREEKMLNLNIYGGRQHSNDNATSWSTGN